MNGVNRMLGWLLDETTVSEEIGPSAMFEEIVLEAAENWVTEA